MSEAEQIPTNETAEKYKSKEQRVLDSLGKFIDREEISSFLKKEEKPLLIDESIEETEEAIIIKALPGCDVGVLFEVMDGIAFKNNKEVKTVWSSNEIIVRPKQEGENEEE